VASKPRPDLSLFVDILHTLEEIGVPYVIIGAFAGTVYAEPPLRTGLLP